MSTPKDSSFPQKIDRYEICRLIGKGGMGEVFLAYDSLCQRQVALKRIRQDLLSHPQIRARFLGEAHITCKLSHPSIIPIYTIHQSPDSIFYTMPFVEGETLKQTLKKAVLQAKKGECTENGPHAVQALMRIFLAICQAVAYAHAQKIIHRDLKLENVIVGKYGEVFVLDWGLAQNWLQAEQPSPEPKIHTSKYVTRMGKIVGTATYMSPERALGTKASPTTEVYALGVILYQLLTLKAPFPKQSLEQLRHSPQRQEWVDPLIAAPHREIPRLLCRIVDRCLCFDPLERYRSVDELVQELAIYTEGRSDWTIAAKLDIYKKKDWEFQENIFISEQTAIAQISQSADWFSLMISKHSFPGNIRIETIIRLGENCRGVGFLISVPEAEERSFVAEGYCLWIGSDLIPSTKLLKSNAEILNAPNIFLKRGQSYRLVVEKIDDSIHLLLNEKRQLTYTAHIPLNGSHIGILSKDADFWMTPLLVSVGNLQLTLSCLAVPDAFLAHRDYPKALIEYHRISNSFPDRKEGREAIFRAGLTFLEQAKRNPFQAQALLNSASIEFEKLHNTPGAPLEYLGKALLYQFTKEEEEEVKCFTLAYRRYPNHPLLPILQEEIVSRLHGFSQLERATSYQFILLTISHIPTSAQDAHTIQLIGNLQKHWEPLEFLSPSDVKIALAFWLAKPHLIGEMLRLECEKETVSGPMLENGMLALLHLEADELARSFYLSFRSKISSSFTHLQLWDTFFFPPAPDTIEPIIEAVAFLEGPIAQRFILWLVDTAMAKQDVKTAQKLLTALSKRFVDVPFSITIRCIQLLLWEKKWEESLQILTMQIQEQSQKKNSLLHFLLGCYFAATRGPKEALTHFSALPSTSILHSDDLGIFFLTDRLGDHWLKQAFFWEKQQLRRQLALYSHCLGKQVVFLAKD